MKRRKKYYKCFSLITADIDPNGKSNLKLYRLLTVSYFKRKKYFPLLLVDEYD